MRESLRGQRQHHLVHPGQPTLPLLDDLRLEGPGHVPGHPDLDRADIGQHCLGAGAVAAVSVVLSGRIVLLVADVIGDLAFQGGLQYPLGQLLQQPVLTGQLQALAAGPVNQHRDQLLVRRGLTDRLDHGLLLDLAERSRMSVSSGLASPVRSSQIQEPGRPGTAACAQERLSASGRGCPAGSYRRVMPRPASCSPPGQPPPGPRPRPGPVLRPGRRNGR